MGKAAVNNRIEAHQPANNDAEEALLGSILIDPLAIEDAVTVVGPGDFHLETHQVVFDAMMRLNKRETPVDFTTLTDELEDMGRLDFVGGPAYITSLINAVPSSIHAPHYATIIHEKSVRRQLLAAAGKVAALAYDETDGDVSPEDLIARAEAVITKMGAKVQPKVVTAHALVNQMLDEIWEPSGRATQRIFTGFPGIDGPMLGIESGRFWAVAAVPGTGKTAVSINVVRGVVRTNPGKVAVLYFHPEQSAQEITQLLWCSGTENVPPIRLKALMTPRAEREMYVKAAGFIESSTQTRGLGESKVRYLLKDPQPYEIEALAKSQGEIANTQITLNDPSGQNINQILATIRRTRNTLPDDVFLFVVFDGAHLIPGMREGSRYEELTTITRQFKIAAQHIVTRSGEASGAIWVNTQLNRDKLKRGSDGVYKLSDLRDSGSWEQDTDGVLFIHRPSVFNNGNGIGADTVWDPFKLIAAKNRQTSQLFNSYWEMHTSTMRVRGRDLI